MSIDEIFSLLKNKYGCDCYGRIAEDKKENDIEVLLTDSRNFFIPDKTLFFAISTKGGNDGHNYIEELYSKGIKNFIVQHIPERLEDKKDINYIIVPDVIKALQEISKAHRKNASEILAIVGSRGKTTVKEILFQLLEPYKKISRSPRSYNSKIGVPLSLWEILPNSDIAIIEAGISRKGEMYPLSETIEPDTVLITNIGAAHAQGFASMEEKVNEKLKIIEGEKVSKVIYPFDEKLIRKKVIEKVENKKSFGWSLIDQEADIFISFNKEDSSDMTNLSYVFKGEKGRFQIKIEKEFDKNNICSALSYLLVSGVDKETIKQSFSRLKRITTRLNVSEGINGCSIVQDSYTSDLSSLMPAIDFLKRRKNPSQSLSLIISDLHHAGSDKENIYKEVARIVEKTGINRLIGIGKSFMDNKEIFPPEASFYSDTENFLNSVSVNDFSDEIILLKGSPEFNFEKIREQLEAKKHETVLEINLDALIRNYNYFREKIPSETGIIGMVKASGYGTGSYEIGKTLQDAGAAYLAVAALDEGIELRNKGIQMPIMILNPRSANYKSLFNKHLEPVIYSLNILNEVLREATKYKIETIPIHIKLDTGMHRMGFEERDLDSLLKVLKKNHEIKVESIFSHLATADFLDLDDFTLRQIELFEKLSEVIISELKYPVKRHILNSAGILRFPEYHYDLVRLGIGLYGANTLPRDIEKPLSKVATLQTVIICIKEIEINEAVGYGRKGKIKKKSKIATLPIGYADGMNRHFGNGNLKVYINGKMAPTIGNICMDATMIDVSGIECKEGDIVEVFGENNSIENLAETLNTIPYEILTSVSPRVKRVYFRE